MYYQYYDTLGGRYCLGTSARDNTDVRCPSKDGDVFA